MNQNGGKVSGGRPDARAREQRREREAGFRAAGVLRGGGCRVFRMQRDKGQFSRGDLLMVVADAVPEGGEYVIDLEGRVGRHGGGPVLGVVVGIVRSRLVRG